MSYNPRRVPNVVKFVFLTLDANSNVYWSPAAGKKFRLMRFHYSVTADAARAAAGNVVMSVKDETTNILQASFNVPATGGTPGVGGYTETIDLGDGVLSTAADAKLRIQLSAALTAGRVAVTLIGTEE